MRISILRISMFLCRLLKIPLLWILIKLFRLKNTIELGNRNSQLLNKETEDGIKFFSEMLEKLHQLVNNDEDFSSVISKNKLPLGNTLRSEINLLYQVSALTTISILDLMTICRGLNTASNIEWLKVFYAKQGYLTIHETITHYDKEYNRELNELITGHHPLLVTDFRIFTDKLKKFKTSYTLRLTSVRNKIAGHIHANFKDYYSTVTDFKREDPIVIISAFLEILTQLQKVTTKILPESINKYKLSISK